MEASFHHKIYRSVCVSFATVAWKYARVCVQYTQQPPGSKISPKIYDWCSIHASLFSFRCCCFCCCFDRVHFPATRIQCVYYFSFRSTVIYVFLLFNWRNASSAWCWWTYVFVFVCVGSKWCIHCWKPASSWYVSNMRIRLKSLENMCGVIFVRSFVCLLRWGTKWK